MRHLVALTLLLSGCTASLPQPEQSFYTPNSVVGADHLDLCRDYSKSRSPVVLKALGDALNEVDRQSLESLDVLLGMTALGVTCLYGTPSQVIDTSTEEATQEQWVYCRNQLMFPRFRGSPAAASSPTSSDKLCGEPAHVYFMKGRVVDHQNTVRPPF
jgi:hypothetical protein